MKYKLFVNKKECVPCDPDLLEGLFITENPVYKVVVNGADHWVEDFSIEEGLPIKINLSTNKVVCKNNHQWWSWSKLDYKLKEEM